MSGRCMIFKKFHAWRSARACSKCSSWIVKEDGQEQHLTCKPNSCFFSFGRNGWHFGHRCLPFSLAWQVSCRCNYCYFGWTLAINRWWIREEKRKRKKKVLDCMKLEYYKELLNFCNIEYYIIFLITQISG